MTPISRLAHDLYPAVIAAGAAIMRHYAAGTAMETKADGSPVSQADREAEDIIAAALAGVAPGVALVAEEAMGAGAASMHSGEFFLVDPLDGTREFAARRPEFTVNIALVRDGRPVFGLIFAPALGDLFWTEGEGAAFAARVCADGAPPALADLATQRLATNLAHGGPQTIAASRSHGSKETEAWLARINAGARVDIGSSLKFCLVASGKADVYPRFGPTMEWDTAAGHAIVSAAGGCVSCTDGTPVLYGKAAANYRNPGFIAWSGNPPNM